MLELHPHISQTVLIGGSAEIQCRVRAGFPVPEVQWTRDDGRPLPPNAQQLPGGVLRLSNITIPDGGGYKCSASNAVGSTAVVAYLEVQSLPTLMVHPSNLIYAKLGERVRLSCTGQGLPPPNVAWVRNTKDATIYSPFRGSSADRLTAIHEISSMSPDDEGSYTCTATNAAGINEERVEIRLADDNGVDDSYTERPDYHIGPIEGGINVPDDFQKIRAGGTVEIRCRVAESHGSQIYLDWKRTDRRPLPEGSVVRDGSLTIQNVTRAANGEYVCLGLNVDGTELFRAKTHLEVISPPRIELNPNRQTVGPGESPAIVCTATGDEPLSIVWTAINRPLPHSVSNVRGVLQFHGITSEDAGKYVCTATNEFGTAEAVAEVLVSGSTIDDVDIRAIERDVETIAGSSVKLRCVVRQRSTIQWSKDGKGLPESAHVHEDYVELINVQPHDSGKYICEIRNEHGVSSDYVNLRVQGELRRF